MAEPRTLLFEIHRDGELIRTERLSDDVIKIGSHPRSHLRIDDPGVSRVHAYVEANAEGIHIIDLGSGRGTFVNGEKVNKRQLAHRDQIQLGGTTIVFMTHDEKALAAAAAAKAAAEKKKRLAKRPPKDEHVYARRFLARPAATDGSVEIAMLYRDYVMAEELFKPPKDVKIGTSKDAQFPCEHASLGGEDFVLIDASGGEPVLRFTTAMTGDLYVGSTHETLDKAVGAGMARASGKVAEVPLTAETRARLVIGEQVFFVHRSNKPKLVLPFEVAIGSMALFLALSLFLHLSFLGVVNFWPASIGGLDLDGFDADNRFVQILIEDAQEEEEEEPEPEPEDDEGDDGEQAEGEAAAEEEGRAGDENEEQEDGRMAVEGDRDPSEGYELARAEAIEEVQNRGALQVLNSAGPTSIFGDSAVAQGYDPVTAIGGVSGSNIGASYGSRGLGRYGGGLGGGGSSLGGGFGAGPIAVRGRSSGEDSNLGREQLQVRDREVQPPAVVMGTAEVRGQLDRDIIQRVVREHRREIRACYESELQRNPNLEGRVAIEWVISPSGAVAASQIESSTLNSQAVENCVAMRVRQWRFPEPRGGGTVRVTYPFVFSPGG